MSLINAVMELEDVTVYLSINSFLSFQIYYYKFICEAMFIYMHILYLQFTISI